ncbi:hypothetical protein Tcan_01947 [Toxocara canis]|uniref:RING-type domain-containing protein n=1 Tax=Toxocara canis TaxID=6265 RepID=A0A0B2UZ57_TOXCA|nr:hypothetical protein Tcan_01947 [Toxocara canis]
MGKRDLARRPLSAPESRSIWVWLWREWLSYHGNCALCDRPLNGATQPVVMNACAHAIHIECAEEVRLNARRCPKCAEARRDRRPRKCAIKCCCDS